MSPRQVHPLFEALVRGACSESIGLTCELNLVRTSRFETFCGDSFAYKVQVSASARRRISSSGVRVGRHSLAQQSRTVPDNLRRDPFHAEVREAEFARSEMTPREGPKRHLYIRRAERDRRIIFGDSEAWVDAMPYCLGCRNPIFRAFFLRASE